MMGKPYVDRLVNWSVCRLIRKSGLFDSDWYQINNPDVASNSVDPLIHYLKYGGRENRDPSPLFDSNYYRSRAGKINNVFDNPLVHHLQNKSVTKDYIRPAQFDPVLYISEKGLFDELFYRKQIADCPKLSDSALLHYVQFGERLGKTPSLLFDPTWYRRSYTDIGNFNALIHYAKYGQNERRLPTGPVQMLALTKLVVQQSAHHDAEIFNLAIDLERRQLPIHRSGDLGRTGKTIERFAQEVCTKVPEPEIVIVIPSLAKGGAHKVFTNTVESLARRFHSKIIIVVSEEPGSNTTCNGLTVFHLMCSPGEFQLAERVSILNVILRGMKPRYVININSLTLWELCSIKGEQLSSLSKVRAFLFCSDYDSAGKRIGYSDRYFRGCAPFLDRVYFDNSTYLNQLIVEHKLPDSISGRMMLARQPVNRQYHTDAREVGYDKRFRPTILWAGRLVEQKNPGLLIKIAQQMPEIEFHMWGVGDQAMEKAVDDAQASLPNLRWLGSFDDFSTIASRGYQTLIYTAQWDGMPNIVLEAGTAGMVVITTDVGGVRELINEQTGFLIERDTPDVLLEFVNAIQYISNNWDVARTRANSLKGMIRSRHSADQYDQLMDNEFRYSDDYD
jgi:glycosyltransferase involved in cell wall biosynthesis